VSAPVLDLEERCRSTLESLLEAGDEHALHQAYEFGRSVLAEGTGVLEMMLLMWRTALGCSEAGAAPARAARVEAFLLECLSPFEMAYRGAQEANAALRHLDERREEEVRRIAHELHDEAGQLLAAVHLALEGLRPHVAPEASARYEQTEALLRQVGEEIRRLSHELRPLILDDLGFLPALRVLGEGIARRCGMAVEVTGTTGGRLPPAVETALYRAAQEALNNVARHARAKRAVLDVRRTEREVTCLIRDDGRGFDPAVTCAPGGRRGLGLEGLRERVARLGGALEVSSRPGRGTELKIRIPLEVPGAHQDPDRR